MIDFGWLRPISVLLLRPLSFCHEDTSRRQKAAWGLKKGRGKRRQEGRDSPASLELCTSMGPATEHLRDVPRKLPAKMEVSHHTEFPGADKVDKHPWSGLIACQETYMCHSCFGRENRPL